MWPFPASHRRAASQVIVPFSRLEHWKSNVWRRCPSLRHLHVVLKWFPNGTSARMKHLTMVWRLCEFVVDVLDWWTGITMGRTGCPGVIKDVCDFPLKNLEGSCKQGTASTSGSPFKLNSNLIFQQTILWFLFLMHVRELNKQLQS